MKRGGMAFRALRAAAQAVGLVLTMLLFAVLSWLFLVATPDQFSAECEAWQAETERAG